VLPRAVRARVSVEAASVVGWDRYVGPDGEIVGMRTFGASAPQKDLYEHFGFTPDNIAEHARATVKRVSG
jgi:transketolase